MFFQVDVSTPFATRQRNASKKNYGIGKVVTSFWICVSELSSSSSLIFSKFGYNHDESSSNDVACYRNGSVVVFGSCSLRKIDDYEVLVVSEEYRAIMGEM